MKWRQRNAIHYCRVWINKIWNEMDMEWCHYNGDWRHYTIVAVYLSLHCNTLKTSAWHGVSYVMLIKDILVEATVNIKHNPKLKNEYSLCILGTSKC